MEYYTNHVKLNSNNLNLVCEPHSDPTDGEDDSSEILAESLSAPSLFEERKHAQHEKHNPFKVKQPHQFKLMNLNSATLRYEVVYKNLLRDVRKFLITDFNGFTNYISMKRKKDPSFFRQCLKMYLQEKRIIDYALDTKTRVTFDQLVLYLGSLMYPKEMLKSNAASSREEKTFSN